MRLSISRQVGNPKIRRSPTKTGFQFIVLFVLALVLVLSAHAQQPLADLSVRADVSDFPQVVLTVTVRDANGVPVPGLDARAFEVNGDRAPEARPISTVEPVTNPDPPMGLVLVVDVSGSMAGQPLADAHMDTHAPAAPDGDAHAHSARAHAGAADSVAATGTDKATKAEADQPTAAARTVDMYWWESDNRWTWIFYDDGSWERR